MVYDSNIERIPPRGQVFFFVLDTSTGIAHEQINAINHAMQEAIFYLKQVQDECWLERTLKVAVLECGRSTRWVSKMPVAVCDFIWQDIPSGNGYISWRETLLELESQLSRRTMLNSETGMNAPVIVFITNTLPIEHDWDKTIEPLHHNNWFKHAIKYAITSDHASIEPLAKLIKMPEFCYELKDLGQLYRVLLDVLNEATTYITIGPEPGQFWRDKEVPVEQPIEPVFFPDDMWDEW